MFSAISVFGSISTRREKNKSVTLPLIYRRTQDAHKELQPVRCQSIILCIYINIKSLIVHYMFTPSLREEEVGCCTVTVTDSTRPASVSVVVLSKVRFTMTALEGL